MAAEEIFKALAAPQRQEILRLVRDSPHSVGEIAEHCDASQQAVSHHLQILKDAGLLAVERQGQRRLYVVNPDSFDTIQSFVAELWPKSLARLKESIEDDPTAAPTPGITASDNTASGVLQSDGQKADDQKAGIEKSGIEKSESRP